MKVSYKALMGKLITPLSGMSLVKVNSAEELSLYTPDKSTKSTIISLSSSLHLVHLQPGDVLVQGHYTRSRKLFNVSDLSELSVVKIHRLEKSNNFTELSEVPTGMHRLRVDHSMGYISNQLLAKLNGLDRLVGVNCHSELKFEGRVVRLEQLPKNSDEWDKARRGTTTANAAGVSPNTFFYYNQLTGRLEVAIYALENDNMDGSYEIAKGVSIIAKNNGRVLEVELDLEVLQFSKFFTETIWQDKQA